MGVLEDGAALHDWYTPGNDICLPSFAGVVEFSLFVQWDESDAWIGADEIHSRPSLCLSLECLNDTLKLMTWLGISFLLLPCWSKIPRNIVASLVQPT
jgi:hypothetical protein